MWVGVGEEGGVIGRGNNVTIFWRRTDSKPKCARYRCVPLNFSCRMSLLKIGERMMRRFRYRLGQW